MKILVPVKRVIDYNVQIQIKSDASGVVTDAVKMSMNPFDEIAMEEAVLLKERGIATEVVAASIGERVCEDVLRHALAMGADRALLIENDADLPLDESRVVAHVLAKVCEKEAPDMVMMGKQAIDQDHNQCGQMLATTLGWPGHLFVSKLELKDGLVETVSEMDGGLETTQCTLPCVLTTDLRLNVPRFIALPKIIQAKRKPLEIIQGSSLHLTLQKQLHTLRVEPPKVREGGEVLTDKEAFFHKLVEKGVLS